MTIITTQLPFKGVMTSNIGGRKENQDTCGYSETSRGLLLVVCDGMGGGPGGKTASSIAATTLIGYVQQHGEQADENGEKIPAEKLLHDAIAAANTALRDKIIEVPELNGMGTTVTAVLLTPDSATVAHVGDSRIYQLRKRNMVFRTADHSRVGEMVRGGALTEEQARLSAISNIITRALGIGDEVQIDVETVSYEKGDRFVLCTDGIWGSMPQEELVKAFTDKKPIENIAEILNVTVENIGRQKGGGHDNYTMIMAEVLGQSADASINEGKTVTNALANKGFPLTKLSPAMIAVIATAILVFVIFLSLSKCSGPGAVTPPSDSDSTAVVANDSIPSDSVAKLDNQAPAQNDKDIVAPADSKKTETTEVKKEPKVDTKEVKTVEDKKVEAPVAEAPAKEIPAATDPELAGLNLDQLKAREVALTTIIGEVKNIKSKLEKIQSNTSTASSAVTTKERIRKEILSQLDKLENISGYAYDASEKKRLFSKNNKGEFNGLRGACDKTPLTDGDFNVMYRTISNLMSTLEPRLEKTQVRIKEIQN